MNTIHFYGKLAEKFGSSFELEVKTPAEAIRALCLRAEGLAHYFQSGNWRVVRGPAPETGIELEESGLHLTLGDRALHVIPAVSGAGGGGGGGAGKILVGAVMVAAAFFTAGTALAAWGALQTGLAVVGVAMIAAGSASLSAQVPGSTKPQDKRDEQSFLFDGPVNVNRQGTPVPLVYGEIITGSVTISAGISVEDTPLDSSGDAPDTPVNSVYLRSK